MKIKFGTDSRKFLTGADLTIKSIQIAFLAIVPYRFIASGNMATLMKPGILSVLFDMGMGLIPRGIALLLSFIYLKTGSEIIFLFISLAIALAIGIAAGKILIGDPVDTLKFRRILLILIAIDTVIGLIPLHFNMVFGLPQYIFGIAGRIVFIVLILMDIRKSGNIKGE